MPVVDLFSEKKVQKICTKFGKKEARKNGTQPIVTLATVALNTRVVRLHQTTILLQFYHNWQMGKNIEQLLSLCRFFSL